MSIICMYFKHFQNTKYFKKVLKIQNTNTNYNIKYKIYLIKYYQFLYITMASLFKVQTESFNSTWYFIYPLGTYQWRPLPPPHHWPYQRFYIIYYIFYSIRMTNLLNSLLLLNWWTTTAILTTIFPH